jgi:hypothetical protein
MLTSILIHQAWLECGDLGRAVADAKRRISIGQWFNDTEALFVTAATPVLDRWQRQQLRQDLIRMLTLLDDGGWHARLTPLMAARPDCGYGSLDALIGDPDTFESRIPAIAGEVTGTLWPYLATAASRHPAITDVITQRIPPQPVRGTLLHGIRTFGEIRTN